MITNASLNVKIDEVKVEIPFTNILGTTASLTTAENKTPNVSDLVKKVDFNGGIKDIKLNISPHLIITVSRIIY